MNLIIISNVYLIFIPKEITYFPNVTFTCTIDIYTCYSHYYFEIIDQLLVIDCWHIMKHYLSQVFPNIWGYFSIISFLYSSLHYFRHWKHYPKPVFFTLTSLQEVNISELSQTLECRRVIIIFCTYLRWTFPWQRDSLEHSLLTFMQLYTKE